MAVVINNQLNLIVNPSQTTIDFIKYTMNWLIMVLMKTHLLIVTFASNICRFILYNFISCKIQRDLYLQTFRHLQQEYKISDSD